MTSRAASVRTGDLLSVIGIVLLGLLPRWYVLELTDWGIESDEAIVGLMAKHITEGRIPPVFYYGQPYMGSLEAIFAAFSFTIFGRSNWALKLVPLLFSLVHIALVYHLALLLCDRFAARVAALLTALGPSALIIWSSKARGGFIELVVIGTLALILAVKILRKGVGEVRAREFFILGLVIGLGWWVNNQVVYYLAAIALVFPFAFLVARELVRGLKMGSVFLAGFFLGGVPFWYYNLVETPRFQSFILLGARASWEAAARHLTGFVTAALPILFGAKRLWEGHGEVFRGATVIGYLLYLGIFVGVLAITARSQPPSFDRPVARSGLFLLVAFCLAMPLIFAMSERGWLSEEPRYLLPLYSVLFVFVGVIASRLRAWRALAVVPVVGVLGLNLSSNYLWGVAVPGQPFVTYGERVSRDHGELYAWLRERGIRHVWTNYWIGYRMAFETDEEVTFSLFRGDRVLRVPEYEASAPRELSSQMFLLVPKEAEVVVPQLRAQGLLFEANRVGSYVVIHSLHPVEEPAKRVPLRPEQVRTSHRPDWAPEMVDGRLDTRWGSGAPQRRGMTVEIDFATPTAISAVAIEAGEWPQDVARGVTIEGVLRGGERRVLASLEGEAVVLPNRASLPGLNRGQEGQGAGAVFFFSPEEVTKLRLVLEGEHPVFDWSIAELSVYGPAILPSEGTGMN